MTTASLRTEGGALYLDGRQVSLYSGAVHYFRVVPEYWRDRLERLKACGLNAVETYVPWNLHEEIRGEFNFTGMLDIRKYIQTAKQVGLYVIIRPGPYICSEWEFGGLPSWLLSDPNMEVRSSYKPFLEAVKRYFGKLLPLLIDLQYGHGGPILAFQIENEYGSYGDDTEYMLFLKKTMEDHEIRELLFTSDNGMGIQRGGISGVLMTANFQQISHGYLMFEYLKHVKQSGEPLVVMEFWTGWFDHWGSRHETWPVEKFEKVLRWLIKQKSSINFYMAHGGTNFGFMNGANQGLGATNQSKDEAYAADVTSYDYDAPIAENGDITAKAHVIREVLQTLAKTSLPETLPDFPTNIPSEAYGRVKVLEHMTLNDLLTFIEPIQSEDVLPMETLNINNGGGQGYGYILYRKQIHKGRKLTINSVRDRAQVLINGSEIGVVDWSDKKHVIMLPDDVQDGTTLDILVENLGRVNYADYKSPILNDQRKGLRNAVLLDSEVLHDWLIYPLEMRSKFINSLGRDKENWTNDHSQSGPRLCRLNLHVDSNPTDTYLNMEGWTKGVVFVNGFNLGRYWEVGPQMTLYLPGPLLHQGDNQILIFEQHWPVKDVMFDERPTLGEATVHKTAVPVGTKLQVAALRSILRLGQCVWPLLRRIMK